MFWVGQFGMEDGQAREATPWAGVYPDRSHDEEASDLYVIVEPALPGSEEFCAELKEAIGSVFHKSKVSLTGGLLRALQGAHEHLRDWNRRSMKEHRVAAGASCLAARGAEAYLAQVAPASAAVLRNGFFQLMEPSLPSALEPLGLNEELWPQFSRIDLEPGDRVLLLSPGLARAIPQQELAAALELPAEDVLPAVYRRARSLPNCAALLVASVADEE